MTDRLGRAGHASAADTAIDTVLFDELRASGAAEGHDFLAELVHQFVHDTEPLLIQLRDALERGDAATVGRIAHSVKGSAGQLGGRRLAHACDRLERRAAAGYLPGGRTDLEAIEIDYRELRRALREQLLPEDRQRPQDVVPVTERRGPFDRVLLAEDHAIGQRVAAAMLENLGFQVDVVPDGAKAVQAANLTRYQAILMDCQLPVLDGYEATRQIRRLEGESRRTPIVAVTASVTESDRQRCLAAGMDDYLTKPLSLKALATVLARWAPDGSSSTDAVDLAAAPPADGVDPAVVADPARPVLDAQVIDRLECLGKAAGEDFVRQLAVLFAADADDRIVALRKALDRDDLAAVARSAHALRGASVILGATEVARLCATLQGYGETGDAAGGGALLEALEAELGRVRFALEAVTATP